VRVPGKLEAKPAGPKAHQTPIQAARDAIEETR